MAFTSTEIFQISYYFARGDNRAAVTRYYRSFGATNAGPSDNFAAAAFAARYEPLFLPLMDGTTTMQGVAVYHVNITPQPPPGLGLGSGSAGTASGDALPPAVAGLVSLYPLEGSRMAWGRVYVPYAAAGDNGSSAVPTASYLTRLDALGAEIITQRTISEPASGVPGGARTVTYAAVLWHGPGLAFTRALAYKSRPKWATQRRRALPPYVQFSPFG